MDKPLYNLLTVVDHILNKLQQELEQKKIFPGINNIDEVYEIVSHLEHHLDPEKNLKFTVQFRDDEYDVLQKKDDTELPEQLAQRKEALQSLREDYEAEKAWLLEELHFLPWKAYLTDRKPLYSGLEIFLFPQDDGTYHVAHFEQEGGNRTLTLEETPYTIEGVLKDIEEANALESENTHNERKIGEKQFRGNILEIQHPDCTDVPTLVYLAVEKMQQREEIPDR